MSAAIVLDNKMTKKEELALPAAFEEINSHNLYLYTKADRVLASAVFARMFARYAFV